MTLNGVGLMAVFWRYFSDFVAFSTHCVKVIEDIPRLSATEI